MTPLAPAYAVCRVDPEHPHERLYDVRDVPYSRRMPGLVKPRKATGQRWRELDEMSLRASNAKKARKERTKATWGR